MTRIPLMEGLNRLSNAFQEKRGPLAACDFLTRASLVFRLFTSACILLLTTKTLFFQILVKTFQMQSNEYLLTCVEVHTVYMC